MQRFEGKTVVVTGGGGGIGGATCRRFGREGARVAVFDRNAETAESVAAAIRMDGGAGPAVLASVAGSRATEGRAGSIRVVGRDGQVVADAEVSGLGGYFVGERVRVLVSSGTREAIVVPVSAVTRRAGVDLVRLADGALTPVQRGRLVPALGSAPGAPRRRC